MFKNIKQRSCSYSVLSQVLKNDEGEEYSAYGITVMSEDGEIVSIPDVSTNYEDMRLLVETCTRECLDPIHLNDVIEDFLDDLPMA